MNLKVLNNSLYGGVRSKDLFVMTASQGGGKTVSDDLNNHIVYYVINPNSNLPHSVYKTTPATVYDPYKRETSKYGLLMHADIAFILEDVGVRLIKNRNGEQKLITDEEELKKYRWDMLRAVEV